jgi:hypothetical protein
VNDGGEATILGAEITAGHDGQAELVVRVRHENGAVSAVVLDSETGLRLLGASGTGGLDILVGRSWRQVLSETILNEATLGEA